MKEYGRFAIAVAILVAGILYYLKPEVGRYQAYEAKYKWSPSSEKQTFLMDTATGKVYKENGSKSVLSWVLTNDGFKLVMKDFIESMSAE